jgi:hypothetical protein
MMQVFDIENIVEVRIATIELRPDKIIQLNIKDDVTLDVADIEEFNAAINNFTKGKPHPILVITGERNGSTRAATKMSMKLLKDENYALAEALVITSFSTRISANFFFKVFKPKFPYKNFKSKGEAEEWLKRFKVE